VGRNKEKTGRESREEEKIDPPVLLSTNWEARNVWKGDNHFWRTLTGMIC